MRVDLTFVGTEGELERWRSLGWKEQRARLASLFGDMTGRDTVKVNLRIGLSGHHEEES